MGRHSSARTSAEFEPISSETTSVVARNSEIFMTRSRNAAAYAARRAERIKLGFDQGGATSATATCWTGTWRFHLFPTGFSPGYQTLLGLGSHLDLSLIRIQFLCSPPQVNRPSGEAQCNRPVEGCNTCRAVSAFCTMKVPQNGQLPHSEQ